MMIDLWMYPVLTAVAVLTGFIDSIAGGGGLIMMPALLTTGIAPLNALGTNKLQSMCGTTVAAWNYGRKGLFDWRNHKLLIVMAFLGSALGVYTVAQVGNKTMGLVIPLLLMAVAAYVLFSPRMSDEDAHHRIGERSYAGISGGIGFYDGFFGPGTGSFFTTTLVGLRGLGLTKATGLTKLLNLTTNVAAFACFALMGQVYWLLGLCMAAGAMLGNYLGSHFAMKHGAKLIRPLLVTLSIGLTAKLLYGYFAG